jgi:hypothetical protein
MTTPSSFVTSEGLRDLLCRLHSGAADWHAGHEAADLMTYAMDKYGALARKHGLDPADAATAAFEVMRTRAARDATDPWAVVTRAVQLTLTYQARADGMLCSTARARRTEYAQFHDVERFSDRETPIHAYHPAFRIDPVMEIDEPESSDSGEPTNAFDAVDRAIEVFIALGWPAEIARTGIEYICSHLMRTGSRTTAFEYLRRDHYVQALLDVDQRSWLSMLRAALGNQHPDRAHTNVGRGVLLLLMLGYDVTDVASMPDVAHGAWRAAHPLVDGGRHG